MAAAKARAVTTRAQADEVFEAGVAQHRVGLVVLEAREDEREEEVADDERPDESHRDNVREA